MRWNEWSSIHKKVTPIDELEVQKLVQDFPPKPRNSNTFNTIINLPWLKVLYQPCDGHYCIYTPEGEEDE